MDIDFVKTLRDKTDYDLEEYIQNRNKYNPDAVVGAIKLLKQRGRNFSKEELEDINGDLNKTREKENKERDDFWESLKNNWDKNVVINPNAPILYSEKAIYIYSALTSVIGGSILAALNFHTMGNKKASLKILIFGLTYTFVSQWIIGMIMPNVILAFTFNTMGSIIINTYFWKKYIGENTKYRTKSMWLPNIIAVIIIIPIVFGKIYLK